jgi:hypothetical protein
MADDLLPPNTPPAPAPDPPASPRSRRILCEFCGCELDPNGNVLRRGESARAYLDLEDENKRLQEKVDTLQAANTELAGQLEAARTPAKRRGFLDL